MQPKHKLEIEHDLKSTSYYNSIFILNILIDTISNEIKYEFYPAISAEDALQSIKLGYELITSPICAGMFDQSEPKKFIVERWIVRVNNSGEIRDELLVAVEDFTSTPTVKMMI